MQQNLPRSAQNYLKLSKTTKICPETINSRTFEIPPRIKILVFFQNCPKLPKSTQRQLVQETLKFHQKFEILVYFKKKTSMCRGGTKA
jgi:hypothetical protein